jgi:hypothetical protein
MRRLPSMAVTADVQNFVPSVGASPAGSYKPVVLHQGGDR